MTENNLPDHLTWLLRPKSNTRQAQQSPSSVRSSNTIVGQYVTDPSPINASSFLGPLHDGQEQSPSESGIKASSLPEVPLVTLPDEESMARLQSGPRSATKGKLLSQLPPNQLRTPRHPEENHAKGSLIARYQAEFNADPEERSQPLLGPRDTPRSMGMVHRETVKPTSSVSPAKDCETSSSYDEHFSEPTALWDEPSALRLEPLATKGTKRKSEDFDPNVQLALRASQGSFVAIEDYPDEPPPPYSSNPGPSTNFVLSNGPAASRAYKNGIILQPSPKRLKASANARECENTVPDSEDDASEDESDQQSSAAKFIDPLNLYPDLRDVKVTHNSSSEVNTREKPVIPDYSQQSLTQDPPQLQTQVKAPTEPLSSSQSCPTIPLRVISPDKANRPAQATPLTNMVTADDKISSLMAIEPSAVQDDINRMKVERQYFIEMLAKQVLEQVPDDPTVEPKAKNLTARIKALEAFLNLRARYEDLTQEKDLARSRLIAAVESDLAGDQENLDYKNARQRSESAEKEILNLFKQAEDLLPREGHIRKDRKGQPIGANTLVRGTQHRQSPPLATQLIMVPVPSSTTGSHFINETQVAECRSQTPQRTRYNTSPKLPKSPGRQGIVGVSAPSIDAYYSPSRKTKKASPRTFKIKPMDAEMPLSRSPGFLSPTTHDYMSVTLEDNDQSEDEHHHRPPHRGSPAKQTNGDDRDEYGYDDYDDENDYEMLEATRVIENDRFKRVAMPGGGDRRPLAETSGNSGRNNKGKGNTQPSQSATQTSLMQHPWSKDVKMAMRERFHLRGFRPNQLEAINATLAGKDTFVLMPTGGGKSLCYQLPSIITSGRTRGLTLVISPLLSLMQDQVDHLQKLQIQAFFINGEVAQEHRDMLMQSLRDPMVERFIQVLYITPEMIRKSNLFLNAFKDLNRRQKLARIVIDEAHCVSQWGHDFRPDYKDLGHTREELRGVPVMALTATATENVKVDVIHNLGMQGCEVLSQSFNRPNLHYEIRPKGKSKDVLASIAETINTHYRDQTGIIYCLSRKTCETVAKALKEQYKIKAEHYHASMKPDDKAQVQKNWQAGVHKVIVATIAFGMGIDKPDVRFVFHHTIPKSLEGYYQETGRAGRDGKRSGCYLYYGYGDTSTLKRMIDDGEGSREQKERQREMLRNVVQFCENRADCRRVQILKYFNEMFRQEDCKGACDNCNSQTVFENRDYTQHAIRAVQLVERIQEDNVTLLHCVDVFRGARNKKITDLRHDQTDQYGAGASLERGSVERLFYRLITEDALQEEQILNRGGFPLQFLKLGRKAREFAHGRRKIQLQIRLSPKAKSHETTKKKKSHSKSTGAGSTRQDYPLSTNVSSPAQMASKRKANKIKKAMDDQSRSKGKVSHGFVVSDGEGETQDSDESDGFEPVRRAGVATSTKKRMIGPPITTDQKLTQLDPIHRYIVDNFVETASSEGKKTMMKKGLRDQPFTITILREMAMTFPRTKSELLQIRGIDPEKVNLYGTQHLRLITKAHDFYLTSMQEAEDNIPQDPNHQNVVEISSDDEFDDDMGLDDLLSEGDHEEEEEEEEERSAYFLPPDVQRFNSTLSQNRTMSNGSRGPDQEGNRGKSNYMRGGGRSKYKKGSGRRSNGSSKAKPTSKVTKRNSNGSRGNSSHTSAHGGGGFKRGGIPTGTSGGGSIGVMPT